MDPFDAPGIALDIDALIALRHAARSLPSGARAANSLPGGLVQKRRGRGLEAADIRHFVEGDDIRLIDRNATARSGQPHVKTVHDERDRTVLLIADFRPSMLWGTRRALRSVAAAEALSLIGWQAVASGARVAALALRDGGSEASAPRARERGMIAAIGALARAHETALRQESAGAGLGADPPLAPALEMAARMVPRGTAIAIASAFDEPPSAYEEALRQLDHRCPVTVLPIRDAFETAAPAGSYRFRSGSGSGTTARIAGGALGAGLELFADWGIAAAELDGGSAIAPQLLQQGARDALARG